MFTINYFLLLFDIQLLVHQLLINLLKMLLICFYMFVRHVVNNITNNFSLNFFMIIFLFKKVLFLFYFSLLFTVTLSLFSKFDMIDLCIVKFIPEIRSDILLNFGCLLPLNVSMVKFS